MFPIFSHANVGGKDTQSAETTTELCTREGRIGSVSRLSYFLSERQVEAETLRVRQSSDSFTEQKRGAMALRVRRATRSLTAAARAASAPACELEASATRGGIIEVRLDAPDGKLLGSCSISNTGGWQAWSTFKAELLAAAFVPGENVRSRAGHSCAIAAQFHLDRLRRRRGTFVRFCAMWSTALKLVSAPQRPDHVRCDHDFGLSHVNDMFCMLTPLEHARYHISRVISTALHLRWLCIFLVPTQKIF